MVGWGREEVDDQVSTLVGRSGSFNFQLHMGDGGGSSYFMRFQAFSVERETLRKR